jgi:hypothetical protein
VHDRQLQSKKFWAKIPLEKGVKIACTSRGKRLSRYLLAALIHKMQCFRMFLFLTLNILNPFSILPLTSSATDISPRFFLGIAGKEDGRIGGSHQQHSMEPRPIRDSGVICRRCVSAQLLQHWALQVSYTSLFPLWFLKHLHESWCSISLSVFSRTS